MRGVQISKFQYSNCKIYHYFRLRKYEVCVNVLTSAIMLSPCLATVDPKTKASATVAPPTVAPSMKKTTSPECGSAPLLVQQGRDGRDGRDGLPGPVGHSGTKGEKGDPGIVVKGATGQKGMYVCMHVCMSVAPCSRRILAQLEKC